MSGLRITGYRVSDPALPSRLGDQLLPHDATQALLELWYEADVALQSTHVSISVERKGGLAGVEWRLLRAEGDLAVASDHITYHLRTLPEAITPTDRQGSYATRFKVTLDHAGERRESFVPFGRSALPLWLERGRCHIHDVDRPEPPATDPTLSGALERLGIEFTAVGEIEEFAIRIRIRERRSRPILAEIVGQGRRNEPLSFVLDPLPAGVRPSSSPHVPNYYALQLQFTADGYTTSSLHHFRIAAVIPPGTLVIRQVVVADHPVFDEGPSRIAYSDLWDRAVVSVLVEAVGYDPSVEEGPATVQVFFADANGTRWDASAAVQFEADGLGWAFVDRACLPPLDADGEKSLRVQVSHNCRFVQQQFSPLHWVSGFRADRVVDVRRAIALSADGTEAEGVDRNTRKIRVLARVYRSPDGPDITLCLVLLAMQLRATYRRARPFTHAIAYQRIATTGTRIEDVAIDFSLPTLTADLFEFNGIAAKVLLAYQHDGVSHTRLEHAGEFPVPRQLLEEMAASAKIVRMAQPRPRPKPEVDPARLSGKHWCAKFPTSKKVSDLEATFAANVQRFIDMLESNGASVRISATLRPSERAYLMHYAFRVASEELSAGKVPRRKGVDIVWNHEGAVTAAQEMVAAYDIVHAPSHPSKHEIGKAIDMTISNLPEKLKFEVDGKQETISIGNLAPHANRKFWRVADRYFGVTKLPSDRPHWFMK